MFREMHYIDHNLKAIDLSEKMAERRRQSLAESSPPSGKTWMARLLLALAVSATDREAAGRA